MTRQENIRLGEMRSSTTLAASVIITGLIAMMSVGTSMNEQSVYAQMIGDHGGFSDMTSAHEDQQEKMINGTINLEQTIFEAIGSKVNTSLTRAMTIAEQSVGNNSFALAAFGADLDGYFVYNIFLGTPGMELYNVMVDPGNGQILATQETSKKEMEKMHLEHSSEVVRSSGGSVAGFPLLIPH